MTGAANPELDRAVRSAVERGLLPADARAPATDAARPWSVVLLTGLGAWLAAVPLLFVVSMLLGPVLLSGVGPYIVGALLLAGAVVVLRAKDVPIFVEQLAVPALLVGGGSLGFGLYRDLPVQPASLVMALMAAGLAAVITTGWLRQLLGAAAAGLLTAAFTRGMDHDDTPADMWLAVHGVLALWLAMMLVQRRVLADGAHARQASAVESFGTGWALATVAALAALSGSGFIVGASVRPLDGGVHAWDAVSMFMRAVSLAGAVLAACLVAQAWRGLRGALAACVAVVLALLAACMPGLGAVLLVLAFGATTRRRRLAVAAALAAAWTIGSFYYQLQWALATKAVVLVAAGAALGALAWAAQRPQRLPASLGGAAATGARRAWIGIASTAAAMLAVANIGIWQKESLIAQGQPLFIKLVPVDPRSLMQGDYMRLNFDMPVTVPDTLLSATRPRVVVRRDARGEGTIARLADAAAPPADGELLLELSPKDGRSILVTDAWYFREGEGKRWSGAKYGEFRVLDNGTALLVGLADAQLQPIKP